MHQRRTALDVRVHVEQQLVALRSHVHQLLVERQLELVHSLSVHLHSGSRQTVTRLHRRHLHQYITAYCFQLVKRSCAFVTSIEITYLLTYLLLANDRSDIDTHAHTSYTSEADDYQSVKVSDRRQSFDGDDLVRGGENDVRSTAHRHGRNELWHKLCLHYLHEQPRKYINYKYSCVRQLPCSAVKHLLCVSKAEHRIK